jgi:hypothetical protein
MKFWIFVVQDNILYQLVNYYLIHRLDPEQNEKTINDWYVKKNQ